MNTRYSDKLKQTFVVGASELKKLYGILQDRIGEVYILAHCADNLYREFETVKDLIAYENPKSKEIRHIRLSARSNDYSKSATIDFFGSSWRGISIDCTGCQDDVSKFKEDTLDVIAGMRAWYDVMHRIYFVYAIFGLFFIVSFIWFITLIAYLVVEFKGESVSDFNARGINIAALPRGVMAIIAILLYMAGCFYNKLCDSLFPPAVFTIGQGKSRFKYKERVQWAVIIGFVVSLAAGFVIAIWQAITG